MPTRRKELRPNENAFCCEAADTRLTRTLTRRAALSAATRVSTLSGRRTPVTPRCRARADADREAGRAHRSAVRAGRARSRHPNFYPAHRRHRASVVRLAPAGLDTDRQRLHAAALAPRVRAGQREDRRRLRHPDGGRRHVVAANQKRHRAPSSATRSRCSRAMIRRGHVTAARLRTE